MYIDIDNLVCLGIIETPCNCRGWNNGEHEFIL